MKSYIIVEKSGNYASSFLSRYSSVIKVTGDDRFEVTDENFNPLMFHGIEELSAEHDANNDVTDFLKLYTGQNDFLNSVKSQFQNGRRLSEKQIFAVRKCMTYANKLTQTQTYSIVVGEYIVVNKFIAKRIAEQNGLKMSHNGFEILNIHRETDKAYLVDVRLSARKSVFCSCCGAELDNPVSKARGIGPVCAEKWGFSFDGVNIEDVNKKVSFTVLKVWIPKSAIKERVLPTT